MILTEAEARQKWCPFARVGITNAHGAPDAGGWLRHVLSNVGFSCNRMRQGGATSPTVPRDLNPAMARCIASDCMAWRFAPADVAAGIKGNTLGCCGLAERPSLHVSASAQ